MVKYQGWAVYSGNRRLTKRPMTEYDARNVAIGYEALFLNIEVREVHE